MMLQVETAIDGVLSVYEKGGVVAVLVVVPAAVLAVATWLIWKQNQAFQQTLLDQAKKVPEILEAVEDVVKLTRAVQEQNVLAARLEAQLTTLHNYYGDKISTLQEKRVTEMQEIVREVVDTMHATKAAAERSSQAIEATLAVIRERDSRPARRQGG